MPYILDNPAFIRLRRTKLRGRGLIVLGSLAFVVYGGLLIVLLYDSQGRWTAEMLKTYFFAVVGIQLGVGMLYTLMLASQNITLEREKYTYDFQRLVAMGPWRLALGKLFGAGFESWCAALSGALFAFIPVMAGVIPGSVFAISQIVVIVSTLLASSFGLMASSMVAKTQQAAGMIALFVMFAMSATGAGISAAVSAPQGSTGEVIWVSGNPVRVIAELYQFCSARRYIYPQFAFFGTSVPMMAGYLLLNFYAIGLMFVIIARRLTDEELSFLRPRHAAFAFVTLQFLLIGGNWNSLGIAGAGSKAISFYHIFNLCLLIALAFGLTPSAELLRARIARGKPNEHWRIYFERSNRLQDSPPITATILFGLAYVIAATVLTIYGGVTTLPAFVSIVMVFAAGIATAALLMYLSIYTDRSALRVGAFILAIASTVPPFFVGWATASANKTVNVSPFSYLSLLAYHPEFDRSFSTWGNEQPSVFSCPTICIATAVLVSFLGVMRVRFLLDMDEAQRQKELAEAKAPGTAQAIAAVRALEALKNSAQNESASDRKPA